MSDTPMTDKQILDFLSSMVDSDAVNYETSLAVDIAIQLMSERNAARQALRDAETALDEGQQVWAEQKAKEVVKQKILDPNYIIFDPASVESKTDGMYISGFFPTVTAKRGGITYPGVP